MIVDSDRHGWIIRPKLWSVLDHVTSQKEGWKILILPRGNDGRTRLACKIIAHFDTHGFPIQDHEAQALVERKASEGSEFYARALQAVAAVILRGSIE